MTGPYSEKATDQRNRFRAFLTEHLTPHAPAWYKEGAIPRRFFREMSAEGWLGFDAGPAGPVMQDAFTKAMVLEELARVSPGVAVADLVVSDLGLMGLHLFGSQALKDRYAPAALAGRTLICLGSTEPHAGSDVAGVSTAAVKTDGGWRLSGTKSYVTNGSLSDLAVVTAVTRPDADKSRRLSMFLVDLTADGVTRKKLDKRVWIPSDLTRLRFDDVFVPDDHLMGEAGRGVRQVLTIFTHSRVPISAMTLGTAEGAFDLAMGQACRRKVFGGRIIGNQAKAFEAADFHVRMTACRLLVEKACAAMNAGADFRLEAAMAKYLCVQTAGAVTRWAADLFGAASVVFDHPVHKFPMDAWASSLGEGTQDIQKLVIARELINTYTEKDRP